MIIISVSEEETIFAGKNLAKTLAPGAVTALRGGLGAGKTAFTRGLALGLGINSTVSSPTYTIVNEYPGTIPLFHFDLYRLNSEDELFDIGWNDYLVRGGVCAVEWSEKAPSALPPDSITVDFEILDSGSRRITVRRPAPLGGAQLCP